PLTSNLQPPTSNFHSVLWLFCDINEVLAFSQDGVDWHTDWWKILIIAFAVLLYVVLLVKFSLYILRLVGVLVCVIIGGIGAWTAKALLTSYFAEWFSAALKPYAAVLSGLLGFMLCFGVSAFVLTMIRKAARPQPEPRKEDK
ncbi:MAG: hypothetical protein IKS83_00705, partial [Victivallales bacterium]|nr:hypothetical protein [Victivallales bacterium]